MRVVVATQSEDLAQLIQYIADSEPEIELISEFERPEQAPEIVARLKPDWIFLLDADFDRVRGLAEQLLAIHPGLRILVMNEDGRHRRIEGAADGGQTEDDWDELSTSEFVHVLKSGEYPQVGKSGPLI